MSIDEEAKMLQNIAFFEHLEPSKLKLLAFTSHWLKFQPGEEICRQGEPGDSAYIITEGTAEVLVDSDTGPVLVAVRGKNDVIGEMAILCDQPRTATVRARDSLSALNISKDVFMQLVRSSPDMAVHIIRTLADRLEESTAMLRDAKQQLDTTGVNREA